MLPINNPNLQKAIDGNYSLSIRAIFSEAWQKVKGHKAKYWGAFFLYLLISFAVDSLSTLLTYVMEPQVFSEGVKSASLSTEILLGVINFGFFFFLLLPMTAGLILMMFRVASEKPIFIKMVFNFVGHFKQSLNLFLTWLITALLMMITLLLAIVCIGFYATTNIAFPIAALVLVVGILFAMLYFYLMVAFSLSIALIVDKNITPFQAVMCSFKAVKYHWFKVFLVYAILVVLISISILSLFIALIWVLPLAMNTFGILFRDIFTIEHQVSEA